MTIICIAGNTGAGKSTLLGELARRFREHGRNVTTVDERVLHHPLLQRMFDRPGTWGLAMQLNFLVQRAAVLMQHAEEDNGSVMIMERSLLEDGIFFDRLIRHGFVDESLSAPYASLRSSLVERCPNTDAFVYVNTPSEICVSRLEAAMRSGSRKVELTGQALSSYVAEVGKAYSAWRLRLPSETLVVDLDVRTIDGPDPRDIDRCSGLLMEWLP